MVCLTSRWYFRREGCRYLGAIALLVIIAVLQLIPPKVVGIVVDGVTQQHYTRGEGVDVIGAGADRGDVFTAAPTRRVPLFGALLTSWRLSCGKIFTGNRAASIRRSICAIAPGILSPAPPMTWTAVFAPLAKEY